MRLPYHAAFFATLFVPVVVAAASSEVMTKEGAHACREALAMNLWDLSPDSPLVRHDMLSKSHCWPLYPGMRLIALERVGKFTRVQWPDKPNESFFVYSRDISKWVTPKEPEKSADVVRRATQVRVENTSEFGVTLVDKKPSVTLVFLAGPRAEVEFTIAKDNVRKGFEASTSEQLGPLRGGGMFGGRYLGLGGGDDFARLKFVDVDSAKGFADVEVEGRFNITDRSEQKLVLQPAKFRIKGNAFKELVRPHTPQELRKTIGE